MYACPQCLPSDTVPIRSWTRTLRLPGIRHRHLPWYGMVWYGMVWPYHTMPRISRGCVTPCATRSINSIALARPNLPTQLPHQCSPYPRQKPTKNNTSHYIHPTRASRLAGSDVYSLEPASISTKHPTKHPFARPCCPRLAIHKRVAFHTRSGLYFILRKYTHLLPKIVHRRR